jgi:hypothetical protein
MTRATDPEVAGGLLHEDHTATIVEGTGRGLAAE